MSGEMCLPTLDFQDCRFLRNPEIKNLLVETINTELNEYFILFEIPETSILCSEIPFIISEKLTDPINVVVIFAYHRNPNAAIRGVVYFYLKVSSVENFGTLMDMFSTNRFSNCTQKIQTVKYFARAIHVYSFNGYLLLPVRYLYTYFKEIDQIRPRDKLFYSFKKVHLREEYFDLISLLSKNTDESETIQTFVQVCRGLETPTRIALSRFWERVCNYAKMVLISIKQKFTFHKNYKPFKDHND